MSDNFDQPTDLEALSTAIVLRGELALARTEIERLRSQLAEARDTALEEAAKLAETFLDWCKPIGMYVNMSMAEDFGHELAAAIRKRKSNHDSAQ